MLKSIRRFVSLFLIPCLLFSSVGYTTVLFACQKEKAPASLSCPSCVTKESSSKKAGKACCKPTVEHKAVKTDSERPSAHRAPILPITLLSTEVSDAITPCGLASIEFAKLPAYDTSPRLSVGTCILLSTFRI